LPTGLLLATNGKISGTPSAEGSFTFQVTVMDGNGIRASKYYTMTVIAVVKAIESGDEHTCALMNSGRVMCWGQNDQGQLGDGTTDPSSTPVEATGVTAATAIAAGSDNTCALLQSKEIVCWGGNASGQLGNQNSSTQMAYATTAGKVSSMNTAVSVSVGSGTACAVTATGEGYCWGAIATGSSNEIKLSPSQVAGIVGATSVAGGYTACATISGGALKCWGGNDYGMLGDNTNSTNPSPVSTQGLSAAVQQVSIGTRHVCAAINGGGLQCWGNNYNDELGVSYGSVEHSYVARTVSALGTTVVTDVAVGDDTSCVVTSNGVVQCWGSNECGSIEPCGLMGDLVSTKVTSPKTIWPATATGAKTLALGTAHGCFLAQDNGVYCWGQNYAGQLGQPTTTPYSLTPVKVPGI
jgi:alpha-tubulin suppressor-like RCC1 family protein